MPVGFGHYPFGEGPFGEWDWSSNVLFRLAPDIYRQLDPANGNAFEKYARGQRYSFDNLRRKIRKFTDLRDPLKARSQYDEVVTLRLGPEVAVLGALQQRGIDGLVTLAQEFSTPTGRFQFDDIGKELIVTGSTLLGNNRRARIIRVVSTTKVLTDPQLAPDAGPFQWELRAFVPRDPSVRTVQIQSGYVDKIANGWVVTDGLSTFEVVGRRHSHWNDTLRKTFVVQDGEGAYFDLTGNLVVPNGDFTAANIGQKIQTNGANKYNVGVWEITGISAGPAPWNITIEQSGDRFPDQSAYYWALLPREELDLKAVPQPHGVAQQQGLQGAVTAASVLTVGDGAFDPTDATPVKYVTVRGSVLGNNGVYEVLSVPTPVSLSVSPVFPGGLESGLIWELRRATVLGDFTQVHAYPQPLLPVLATDFGITVDTRESEFLQRSNVDHVGRWVNIKGHPKAYEVLGELTGMEVSVEHLWRISQELYLQLYGSGYTSQVFEAGDANPGRFGQTGRLKFIAGRVHLIDLTAKFAPTDLDLVVRVSNVAVLANAKLYTVDQYISPTEVAFRIVDGAVTPEYGVGGTLGTPKVFWSLERLFTTLEPRRVLSDDVDADLLAEIVDFVPPGTDTFALDWFCWEAGFSTKVPYVPVSVVALPGSALWQVVVATPFGQPGSAEVINVPDRWVLVDADGTEYGIETKPVAAGLGQWSFTVAGALPPTLVGLNPTYLYYDCPIVASCDFCAANWIALRIDYGPELAAETGTAIENIYVRTLERIEQIKPIHVRILPFQVRQIEAKLNLTASIEPHPWLGATLLAPLTANYDDFPADTFPTDLVLSASVEPP